MQSNAFRDGEERKRVLDYGSPPAFLYRTHTDAPVSQLAGINQGLPIPGATEVLLHSRDRSIGARHAYLQRKVYSPNSRSLSPVSLWCIQKP